jgi:hypothetical protein
MLSKLLKQIQDAKYLFSHSMYTQTMSQRIIFVGMIFAITITTAADSILLESGIINLSYAQVFQVPSGSETTPGANPMCDPTGRHVNTRKSHVCGVPKMPSTTATLEPTRTEPPNSITPPSGSSLQPIPGILPMTTNGTLI